MSFPCPNCNKMFKKLYSLNYHCDKKVCSKSFKCNLCNQKYKSESSLSNHKLRFCKMNPKSKLMIKRNLLKSIEDDTFEEKLIKNKDIRNKNRNYIEIYNDSDNYESLNIKNSIVNVDEINKNKLDKLDKQIYETVENNFFDDLDYSSNDTTKNHDLINNLESQTILSDSNTNLN